jgi:thiamine kinase-like enzyme
MAKLLILRYLIGCILTLLISQTTGWIVSLSAANHANAGPRDSYSRRHFAEFASSRDSDIPDTVTDLLMHAGIDANNVDIEKVNEKAAFCNTLYRIRYNNNATCLAKLFSPLALQRMDPSRTLGELDRLAASAGLSPKILASNSRGILMEACVGHVLTEELVQQPNFSESAADVASGLARLHHLPAAPSETNILWKACNVMLSLTDEAHMDTSTGWTLSRLHRTIEQHRQQLDNLQLPITACGHGDCKPSNVFLSHTIGTDKSVKFIDLELAGTHYRAFDVAKFWRTNSNAAIESTDRNRNMFYNAYASTSNAIAGGKPVSLASLEIEVHYLLPLTWLEAALFFACMATQDATAARSNHWNELALDRLESYTQCMQGRRFDRLFAL